MNPVLRKDLEFLPIRYEGKTYFLVRDPWEFVPEGRLLPSWLLQFLSMLDGNNSLRDLQWALMKMRGGGL
ncbi:MAG: AmmeMemoRadiSam system protein B, partial [Desulfatiglandales bacterium]